MEKAFEIRELHPFTQAEIWPIISGYETGEIYAVEKSETDQHTRIDIRLVRLEKPFQDDFYLDFTPEECEWHSLRISRGGCFGAYQAERLVGFLISEAFPEEQLRRVFEIQILPGLRRMGIGQALMERVISEAEKEHLPVLMLETQNTNVNAIRFYRKMGFTIESIDLSPPHYPSREGQDIKQVAFYMKRKVL